ncbi:hypothetical protein LINPERHAP1_LOCUS37495 [Linum perenne]
MLSSSPALFIVDMKVNMENIHIDRVTEVGVDTGNSCIIIKVYNYVHVWNKFCCNCLILILILATHFTTSSFYICQKFNPNMLN